MPHMITEPSFTGYISSTHDALLVFECVRRGIMPRVNRRLREDERKLIRSGAVFVFDEKESGIKRWTDGLLWSPSRILWNFLVYRQIEKKTGKGGVPSSSSMEPSSASQLPPSSADFTFDPLAQGVSSYPSQHIHQQQHHSRPGSDLDSPNSPYPADATLSSSGDLARGLAHTQSQSRLHAAGRIRSVSSASDSAAMSQRKKPYSSSDSRSGHATQQILSSLASSSGNDDGSPLSRGISRSASSAANREAEIERALVGSLKSSYPFAKDGLCKKTISIQVHGSTQHLISYYKVEDVRSGRLRTPLSLPEISGLDISPMILQKSNFRNPPNVEVLPDGTLRYRGDGSETSRRTGGAGSGSEGTSGSDGNGAQTFHSPTTRIFDTRMNDAFGKVNSFEVKLLGTQGPASTTDVGGTSRSVFVNKSGGMDSDKAVREDRGEYSSSAIPRGHSRDGGTASLGLERMNAVRTFENSSVGGIDDSGHDGRRAVDFSTVCAPSYWQQPQLDAVPTIGRYSPAPRLTLDTVIANSNEIGKVQQFCGGRDVAGASLVPEADSIQAQQPDFVQQPLTWPKIDLTTAPWAPSGGVAMLSEIGGGDFSGRSVRSDGPGWPHQHQQQQQQAQNSPFSMTSQEAANTLRSLDDSDTSGHLPSSSEEHFSNATYQHQHLQTHDLHSQSPLVRAMRQQALHDQGSLPFDIVAARAGAHSRLEDGGVGGQAASWQTDSVLGQLNDRPLSSTSAPTIRHSGGGVSGMGGPGGTAAAFEGLQRPWQTSGAENSMSTVGDFGAFAFQPPIAQHHREQQIHQAQHGLPHHLDHSSASWTQEQELGRQQQHLMRQQQQHQQRQ